MRTRYRAALAWTGAAVLVMTSALLLMPELPAAARSAAAPGAAGRSLPRRIYAPYFEAWTRESVATVAQQSGARYLTLAFIQAAGKKGAAACTPTWNGNRKQPISAGRYLAQIVRVRKLGGDVIPSFGGYSADQGGTEIADACHSVAAIARAYEQVITVYHVTRLDMDVEARSLTNRAGIERRSRAIALAQRWARACGIRLQIQFTIGIEPHGLDKQNLNVVRSAVAAGVRVSSVNLMVFDYYLGHETKPLAMGKLAIEAVSNAHRQLARVFPWLSRARVWHLEGMTMLPGIDDYPKKTEVTSLADAQEMMRFARAHGMNFLSIWAIQRDNGGCPGAIDSNRCSGITQTTWAFSHLLEPYSG
ncbi:MAG TPA: hypothetical protein VLX31_04995 [Streptosporangiaceae bacterium]|nr:hypothetical protein [Streptosporangiaceae bacterium]